MFKKVLFSINAAAITHQGVVCSDYPVAGDDNWNGVLAVGFANCSYFIGISQTPCQFAIADRLSIGNLLKRFPHRLLEGRTLGRKGQGEGSPVTVEIFIKL